MRQIEHKRTRRGPCVEVLEPRLMLDGNVQVSLRGGDLMIRGDSNDNQVEISQPTDGRTLIEGIDGTTVNGQESVEVAGVLRYVTIQMRQGGEDFVAMQGPIEIVADLRASFGDGELSVEGSAGPIEIGRNLNVVAGDAGNVSIINQVTVEGDVSIRAGGEVVAVAGLATVPDFDAATFSDSLAIDNPYLPFVPGTTYTFEVEGIDDDTDEPFTETIIVEVLPDTRTILGVEVRIVRDRVFVEGLLVEDTFDWYAQDDDGNVWYLGEDVTNFEYDDNGNLISTNNDGAWEAGVDDAVPGTVMQADPLVGDRYHQEFQPGGVLDQAEVLSRDETLTVPVGTFDDVLRTKDGSVREPFGLEHKVYAPGLGLIGEFKFDLEDDEIIATARLVSVELNGVPVTQIVPTSGFMGTNADGEALEGVEFEDSVNIRSGEASLLNGAEVGGAIRITSSAEAFIIDSVLDEAVSMSGPEAVSFRNVSAEGRISIRGDGDVFVFDSALEDLRILLGPSDNVLAVRDSEIGRLVADGGPGDNTFEDLGGNTIDRLQLTRF